MQSVQLGVRIPLIVYSMQSYVIKFVTDLWHVGGFSPGTPVFSTKKTDRNYITEIFLKVALNTINLYVSNFTFPQYCNVNLPHAFYFGFQSFEYEIKVPDEGYSRN